MSNLLSMVQQQTRVALFSLRMVDEHPSLLYPIIMLAT